MKFVFLFLFSVWAGFISNCYAYIPLSHYLETSQKDWLPSDLICKIVKPNNTEDPIRYSAGLFVGLDYFPGQDVRPYQLHCSSQKERLSIHIPIVIRAGLSVSPINFDLSSASYHLGFRLKNLEGKQLGQVLGPFGGSKLGIGLGFFFNGHWLSNSFGIKLRIFDWGCTITHCVAAYSRGIRIELRQELLDREVNDPFLVSQMDQLAISIGKPKSLLLDDSLSPEEEENEDDDQPLLTEAEKKEDCGICYEALGAREVDRYTCVHRFHLDCSQKWIEQCEKVNRKPRCPMCRTDIN